MRVYDPDPVRVWEVSGVQQTGTFSMLRCAGVTAARNTDAHTCTAELPRKADELIPAYFCRDCRGRIAEVSRRGFILADLYDLTDIQTYALFGEASYSIRGYDVSVSRRGRRQAPACRDHRRAIAARGQSPRRLGIPPGPSARPRTPTGTEGPWRRRPCGRSCRCPEAIRGRWCGRK